MKLITKKQLKKLKKIEIKNKEQLAKLRGGWIGIEDIIEV